MEEVGVLPHEKLVHDDPKGEDVVLLVVVLGSLVVLWCTIRHRKARDVF